MKKLIFLAVLAVSVTFPISHALSTEFAPIGSESISMGGAGVASARSAYAPYYNPALLAEYRNNVDIAFAVSASVRNVELADKIDKMADINFNDTVNNILNNPSGAVDSINNLIAFKEYLLSTPDQNGLQIMPGINLGCQIKQFGFGLYTVSDATATAVIDQTHNSLIIKGNYGSITGYVNLDDPNNPTQSNETEYTARSIEYALNNGLTYIDLTGLAYVEIPVSGGYQFDTKAGKIDVGGSIKVMPGYTIDKDIKIDTSTGDVSTDLRKDTKSSVSWGIDLGLLYRPPKLDKLAIGVVGKNLNTPKFKTASDNYLKVKPMARIGVAYDFLDDKLSAALDADLTKNETYIPDYYSQYIGGGVNYKPANWFSLRCGLMQNIQESGEGLIITAGLGIGHKLFQFDLSALGSTKTEKIQGYSVPEYAKVQLGISSRW